MVAPVAAMASVSDVRKLVGAGIADVLGAHAPEQVFLLLRANDIDQADPVLQADAVEHLAEVGGGSGMDQRLVAFGAHGLHHAERRQRIDEG